MIVFWNSILCTSENRLFEQNATLKTKNSQLSYDYERLRQENVTLQIRADSGYEKYEYLSLYL